jgi:HK97 gp10 family phage protein
MARDAVTVEGGEELLRRLHRMGIDVGQVLEAAALAGAEPIRQDAGRLAPEPRIRAEVVESSSRQAEVAIGPEESKWYWRYLETGVQSHEITGQPLIFEGDEGPVLTGRVSHPGMAARPFLRPAFDAQRESAVDEAGARLRRAVERR